MIQLHKLEKHHYYLMIFLIGFGFGFISGAFFNGQALAQSLFSGLWYGTSAAVFTIIGYEVGIKKRRG